MGPLKMTDWPNSIKKVGIKLQVVLVRSRGLQLVQINLWRHQQQNANQQGNKQPPQAFLQVARRAAQR